MIGEFTIARRDGDLPRSVPKRSEWARRQYRPQAAPRQHAARWFPPTTLNGGRWVVVTRRAPT